LRGNIPIPEIPHGEDLWLIVLITSVRERRTQQGRLFCDASARNATGTIALKIWGETLETQKEIKPGLWGITGKLETFQDRSQFVVAEYRPITLEQYREHQQAEPQLPRAYTIDIETLTLPTFANESARKLERSLRLGNMRVEQQQRYLEDIAAEEERCYALGALRPRQVACCRSRCTSVRFRVWSFPTSSRRQRARVWDRQVRLRRGREEALQTF
jgi:DNA polymerase III alpha subunit